MRLRGEDMSRFVLLLLGATMANAELAKERHERKNKNAA
jgi:hypothetical protein